MIAWGVCRGAHSGDKFAEVNPLLIQNFGDLLYSKSMVVSSYVVLDTLNCLLRTTQHGSTNRYIDHYQILYISMP